MVVNHNKWWPRIGILAAVMILSLNSNKALRADEKDPLKDDLLKLNSFSKEDDQKKQLRALLKDRDKAKKMVAYADKMMKEAKGDEKPFNYNGSWILSRAAHIVKQYETAAKFYELQVELATKIKNGKKMVQAYEGLIEFYFDTKRWADAVETCEKFEELTSPKEVVGAVPLVHAMMCQAKAKQGKYDEAMRDLKPLLELEDYAWYFLQTKALIQKDAGKLKDAIDTYKEALGKLEDNKELSDEEKDKEIDRLHYLLSGVYVENKEIDKAAERLQTLIKRNPDNSTYKNDLGFIWCDNDLKLEESEKLIKEAMAIDKKDKEKAKADGKIEEVKENAAYLDSLGWVYYKQKKYKEALEPLQKAAIDEDEGGHLEIWDHLADCYLALGKKKDALESWEKGLKMDDVSTRDSERRRKVSEKLKKLKAELSK
jgi:tetratricopeptide (TPR) repeat protein